jgi:hypothetical protein
MGFMGFISFDLDTGLLVTMVGVLVAGFAAVLGIWMERDERKPPRYAYALSGLILLATLVSVLQSYLDSKSSERLEEDMARLLLQMDKLAAGDPALAELLHSELAAQNRSNPDIVQKLAQRVSDEGGDPTEMLAKHLDSSEVEAATRKGLIKSKKSSVATKDPPRRSAPDAAKPVEPTKEAAAVQTPEEVRAKANAMGAAARGQPGRPGAGMGVGDPRAAAAAAAAAKRKATEEPPATDAGDSTADTEKPAPVRKPGKSRAPRGRRSPRSGGR